MKTIGDILSLSMKSFENIRTFFNLMVNFFSDKKIHLVIIVFLTFLVYSNIFANGYVQDDQKFIADWEAKKAVGKLPLILAGDVADPPAVVYRPLRGVLYAIYWQIFGSDAFGYHLHSIAVQIAVTVMVYLILEEISRKKELAFIGALAFGLHPIHTEAITFMTSSMDIPGILLLLVSFYFYIKFRKDSSHKNLKFWLSIVFALLAFFWNEITIILPLLIIGYGIYFEKETFGQNWKNYIPYFLAAGVFVILRSKILSLTPALNNFWVNGEFNYVQLLMPKVFVKYIYLMIVPLGYSINHVIAPGYETFNNQITSTAVFTKNSFLDLQLFSSLAFLSGLIFWGIKSFKNSKFLSFGIFWFFVGLLPVSNMVSMPSLMYERYTYTASVGFVIVLAYLIFKLDKRLRLIAIILMALLYSFVTYNRNSDWQNETILWTKAQKVYPQSVTANYNMANINFDNGDFNKAISYYQKVTELRPNFYNAWFNLAETYKKVGKDEEAANQYKKVLSINPAILETYIFLGDYYIKSDRDLALKYLIAATKINKKYLDLNDESTKKNLSLIYSKIGSIYRSKGEISEAFSVYENALKLDKNNVEAQRNFEELGQRKTK